MNYSSNQIKSKLDRNLIMIKRIWNGLPRGIVHLLSFMIFHFKYRRRNKNFSPNVIRSILVSEIDNIGDVILITPILIHLRKTFINAHITALVHPSAKEIVDHWANQVLLHQSFVCTSSQKTSFLTHAKRQTQTFNLLRKHSFDLVLDFRSDFSTVLFAYFGDIKYRFDCSSKNVYLTLKKLRWELLKISYKETNICHIVDKKCELLEEIGQTITDRNSVIPLSKHGPQEASQLFERLNIPPDRIKIIIAPFASWKYKEWGGKNFIQLIRKILAQTNIYILLSGSPSERARIETIASEVQSPRVFNIGGKTSLSSLAAVIHLSSLVICNDSMAAHLSAGVSTPVLALFGPQEEGRIGARGKKIKIIRKAVECSPCRQDYCVRPDANCMSLICVEEVFCAVMELLHST